MASDITGLRRSPRCPPDPLLSRGSGNQEFGARDHRPAERLRHVDVRCSVRGIEKLRGEAVRRRGVRNQDYERKRRGGEPAPECRFSSCQGATASIQEPVADDARRLPERAKVQQLQRDTAYMSDGRGHLG